MARLLVVSLALIVNVLIVSQLTSMGLWNYFFAKAPSVDELLSTHSYEALNHEIQAEVASESGSRIAKIHAWTKTHLTTYPVHPFLLYADAYITLHQAGSSVKEKCDAVSNIIFCMLQSRVFYEVISTDMHVWFCTELRALAEMVQIMDFTTSPHADAIERMSFLADQFVLYKDEQLDVFMKASKALFFVHIPPRKKHFNEVDAVCTKMSDLSLGVLHWRRVVWSEFVERYLPRLCVHLMSTEWIPVSTAVTEKWELVSKFGVCTSVDVDGK